MTVEEMRKNILENDDFVVSEIRKVQVLYEMKKIIRYGSSREEVIDTESNAEHVFAMHCLSTYFLPLETDTEVDKEKIYMMIQFHDIDEIETGDLISYRKTQADKAREHEAQSRIIKRLPESMQEKVSEVLKEYDEQQTFEARFVKALDKIEPVFHLFCENGLRICEQLKPTIEEHRSIKDPYTKPFIYIYRFQKVAEDKMEEMGYYHKKA